MQKIAMVHPNLYERGGAERKLILLSKELVKLGYEVDIIVKEYNKDETFYELIDNSLNIINLSERSKLKWFLEVIKILKQNDYNLIVSHNYPANIPVGCFNLFNKKDTKSIWICNEVATLLNRKSGFLWQVYYKIEKYLSKYFDLIIANSSFTADSINKYFKIKSEIIRSGVEIKDEINIENISPEIKNLVNQDYLFSLSRIEMHKNIELLEKIAKNTNLNIYVAGKGNDVAYLNKLEKDSKNIKYLGLVNEDEKFYLYKYARLFLFLPRAEPLGVTTMEALSQNTPVIGYNNGGPKEIILNKKNGFLSENDEEYLEHIKFVIDNNFIVDNSREYINQKFSNKRMTRDFIKVFENILKVKND